MGPTVLVLGDQLNRSLGALSSAEPGTDRVRMVESDAKLRQRPGHRQKLTYVLSAMRHFAEELRDGSTSSSPSRRVAARRYSTSNPLVLETFYRMVRREHGWLMDADEPLGGGGTSTTRTASDRHEVAWIRHTCTARGRTTSTRRCAPT